MADLAAVAELFRGARQTLGRPRHLVNNAGSGGEPVADQPHEAWDRIVRTNLCGLRNLTRAPAPEPSPDRVDVDNLALGM